MAKGVMHTTNRLKGSKSPYLRQHAENPVDWYPWSGEALEKAKKEDRPLIISIGYSSCHWCHVMEKESFEDAETARIMNDNFVNIKIDREERPELDSLYMKAVQAMTGHAGWPLTVFASPEGVPFYGGSYFPTEDRFGLPSFKKVLFAVSLAYKKNKNRISLVTSDVEEVLSQKAVITPVELVGEISDTAYDAARLFFDSVHGGFGRGTKFPHTMFLGFLLEYHIRTAEKNALMMVKKSLSSMAEGGIYDHIGGGFHRYSVDEMWNIPHFEKMLYDNALLAGLYADAYASTDIDFYKGVSLETIGYMMREMRDPRGGFYSAQDADVEGREGAYYLWGAGEINAALGAGGAKRFMEFFSVTDEGNYEGANMLRINPGAKGPQEPLPRDIVKMKSALFSVRQKRRAPDTDRKIITAWNGLAASALCRAALAFRETGLLDEAKRCVRFLLSSNRDEKGRVMRYYLDGRAGVKGNLEDYALLADALVSVHGLTGDREWLREAHRLADAMIELFYDPSEGLFFDTGKDQERLFVRERDLFDNDLPSGNSAAAGILFKLSRMLENNRYRRLCEGILRSVEGIKDEPLSYGRFLSVLESILAERSAGGMKH